MLERGTESRRADLLGYPRSKDKFGPLLAAAAARKGKLGGRDEVAESRKLDEKVGSRAKRDAPQQQPKDGALAPSR